MLKIGDKEYRNLQEQVQKNKDDIAQLVEGGNIADLGINVVNSESPLPTAAQLPNPATYSGAFGDAYIVGTEAPFGLYVFSRSTDPAANGFWFYWGLLNAPSVVPGPIGPQGIQGEQGIRGSFWYSQSGAPTNTVGVNDNDQALDGSSGDTYQFVDGEWQLTGNIRGPQGIQGIQGLMGPTGPQGIQGPPGPQGAQGEFIQIVGTLADVNQLPMIDTVPRSTAYLIPDAGIEHVWLIIGDGTSSNPYLWHDAGGFGGGTNVLINGVQQGSVDVKDVVNGAMSYQIGENTQVTVNGSEVAFTNLQATGVNLGGQVIDTTGSIELPIAAGAEIEPIVEENTLQFKLTDEFKTALSDQIDAAQPVEVQINAPTSATQGQISPEQLSTLQSTKGAYLLFNDEIYRLQDAQHVSGYLVYSHLGYENTAQIYKIKCITITINTLGWVLTERTVPNGSDFLNKSGGTLTGPLTVTTLLGAGSSNNYGFIPVKYITRLELGLGVSNTLDEYIQAWIQRVCELYPNTQNSIFIGSGNPVARATIFAVIYNTSEKDVLGTPRYVYGSVYEWPDIRRVFHITDYTYTSSPLQN